MSFVVNIIFQLAVDIHVGTLGSAHFIMSSLGLLIKS